jgi:type I restriction enzyme, S subunit
MLEMTNNSPISNWIDVKLGEIIKFKSGKSRPDDFSFDQDAKRMIPVYGGNGISGYTSMAFSDRRQLVIGRVGEYCGCVHIADAPNWVTDNALYSDEWLKEGVDLEFLAKYLNFLNLNRLKRKGGQPLITQTILHELKLLLPPLPEQRAISRVLRAVQQAREGRLREIALERERKAALMEHLFRHGTKGEATKQTDIGEMPESWGIVKLGEVVTATQYGLSLRGNSEGSYPILRMNCLVDGYVNDSNLQYVDLKEGDFDRFRLNKGDLLFNRTNSCDLVGKTGLFNLNGDFVFASYLIRIAVHTSRLLPEFINYYINMNTIQIRLRMLASRGVSQSNINATKLKDFLIPLPSCPEQKIVVDTLRACDAKIAALEHEARLHDELFRAMLEELMTGRLRAGALAEKPHD